MPGEDLLTVAKRLRRDRRSPCTRSLRRWDRDLTKTRDEFIRLEGRKILGVTESRIGQIHGQVLRRLRTKLEVHEQLFVAAAAA